MMPNNNLRIRYTKNGIIIEYERKIDIDCEEPFYIFESKFVSWDDLELEKELFVLGL